MSYSEELNECLMTVTVVKNEDGVFVTTFKVPGGTVNEFTFGTDENEAKAKTNHLIENIKLGLEYVQNQVREAYSNTDGD